MTTAKPRDRKCATCRFYEVSPLWRRGWCRNPLLYDPQTNHLVEADSLACSRTFIDYWEARQPGQKGASTDVDSNTPLVRRAPSIPLTTTGPGGAPLLKNTGPTVAAIQAAYRPRERTPQLSLVKPAPPAAADEPPEGGTRTEPLAQVPLPSAPTQALPVARPAPSNAVVAGRPEPAVETRGGRLRRGLLASIVVAGAVLAFLLVRGPHPGPAVTPTAVPTVALAALPLVPSDTPVPVRTATPRPPTAVPTPRALVLAPGANAQLTGLSGSGLNVRQTPNTKARVLGSLRGNVTVHIVAGPQIAEGITWWQIAGWDSKGTAGWASGKYLKPVP